MSELAATSAIEIAAAARPATGKSGGIMQRIKAFTGQPAVAKSLPAVGMIVLLGLAALLWMAFSAAPGRTIFAGADDADKAAIVEALEQGGISHKVDSSGAVTVSEDDFHKARMLLASRGLPRSAPDGNQVMADLPLGASRAVEGERIRASRQMDLARTIEAIDAVRSARVHIAEPGQSVFVRDRAAAAASVMLTLQGGRTLTDGQVQAIIHLVASSVPGLTPENVSVVDQNGRLLSRAGDSASGTSDRQIATQQAMEERYRQAISTLLTPIVGAGNFTAEVHADVDFSEVEASREAYPEAAGRTIRTEQGTTSTESGPAAQGAGGIPGALSDQPPAPATTSATPDPLTNQAPAGTTPAAQESRRNEQYNRSFAVGREVSVTRNQVGTVRRLSVAVAIRNPDGGRALTRDEIQSMENLVRGAVGASQERGDVVAITARTFASEEEPATSWWDQAWFWPAVRSLGGLIIALAVVFFIGRPLVKKLTAGAAKAAADAPGQGLVGQEIAAALADQRQHHDPNKVTIEMIEAAPSYEARASLIRNFVRQDPARAALVVRDLIRADAKGEGNG
jgi:flagellar M-ring protein FliF